MADQSVTVEFGAKTDEIDKGSADVKDKLQTLQDQTNAMAAQFQSANDAIAASFDKVSSSMGQLESGFKSAIDVLKKGSLGEGDLLKLLLGGAIGGAVAEAVKSVRDMGDEYTELEKHAREATLTLTQYYSLQKVVKDEVNASQFASGIEEAAKKWNDLNHGVTETSKLLDANNVKWREQGGQILSFNDYIYMSAALIKNARTEVDKFKIGELLGFSREWVRALQDGPVELKKAADEAGKTAAEHLKLIERAHEFSDEWKTATQDWGDKFKAIMVDLFPYIEKFVNLMLDGIGAWVTILGQARTPALAQSITAAEHAAIVARNAMQGVNDQFAAATANASRFKDTFAAFSGGIPGIQSQFKKFVDENSNLPKFWQQVYNEITETGKAIEKLGDQDFFSKSGTKIPSKEQFDSASLREFQEQLDEAREKYQQLKLTEEGLVEANKKTTAQMTADLKAGLNERETTMDAVFAEELMKWGDNAKMKATIERNFNREYAAIVAERLKVDNDALKKSTQEWEAGVNSIVGAFNSQLKALLAHTETWKQAMTKIAGDLVIKIIEEFEKLAIVKPLSSMLASSLSAPTELFAQLAKVVSSLLGPLTAGFTSFFAPTLGPAAPAAGAAAAATVDAAAMASVGSFETGTDYVPRTGLALIHQGERIIPAAQNAAGAGTAPNLNFNITALDASGVQAFFNKYAGQISRTLTNYQNLNPSLS